MGNIVPRNGIRIVGRLLTVPKKIYRDSRNPRRGRKVCRGSVKVIYQRHSKEVQWNGI